MKNIISAHQPNYLPNLAFFYKMHKADRFILLDHVQYEKQSWQNRNRIRDKNGEITLIVPVKKSDLDTPLNQVMIDNSKSWQNKHWKSIEAAYHKAPFWYLHSGFFKELYEEQFNYLVDINLKIIGYLAVQFGIHTLLDRSNYYGFKGKKTELLIEMTKRFGCSVFLSGQGGKDYVDETKFKEAGLTNKYIDFKHPVYKQIGEPFIPNMSAIDLLFHYDTETAMEILFGGRSVLT